MQAANRGHLFPLTGWTCASTVLPSRLFPLDLLTAAGDGRHEHPSQDGEGLGGLRFFAKVNRSADCSIVQYSKDV